MLGHGDLMKDAPLLHVSPFFLICEMRPITRVSHFIQKGDRLIVARLALIQKRDS
jgi:hypothetical protein